ncbi:MAG: DUF2357 domain-containing protein [Emergencia sp.]
MENTINDLYLKYVNNVSQTLEDDRYFQYLFEMVQAGSNTLHQTNKVLHKVVDERWLTTIEESLDAINEIIDKPRRFITTSEEVVPVALAKKITADSVRHLSMNTQFIASDEDGDIQPTRVLNVTTEESYDLYENRFVYHLIQRLATFIDKRTDVIFWSTGDEIRNTLMMESKIDDAYEEIEYKVEMKIKNRQSFAENDSDNLQVFMRIDRVRRLVMALRNSSFCSLMAGCSRVSSPIQRTNLMMKDPNYRTCYKLWQFLESYDEVGYTIEERDSALEFDEEYLIQMYTNIITNYTVFKSLLEGDARNLNEIEVKEREVVKPKFIKQIEEEIVDDYNIPDVEIRKVIIEEVTQAQLDAEAKLEEETNLRKIAEEERAATEVQLENERWRMQMETFELQQAAEEQVKAAEERASGEIAKAQIRIEKAEQEAKNQIEQTLKNSKEQIDSMKSQMNEEISKTRQEAEEEITKTKQESESEIAKARQEADTQVKVAQQAADIRVQDAEEQVRTALSDAQAQIEEMRRNAEAQIAEIKRQAEEAVQKAEQAASDAEKRASLAIHDAETRADSAIRDAESRADSAIQDAETRAAMAIEEAETREKEARALAEQETEARIKAEAKADASRLSNRLADAVDRWLNGKNNEE